MKSSTERRLQRIFKKLPRADQKTVLAFAEFLAARIPFEPIGKPNLLPRPAKESVIAAIKRLSQSYQMLDKSEMFGETSTLMTQHLMQGRSAEEVIDELEIVFSQHYEKLISNNEGSK